MKISNAPTEFLLQYKGEIEQELANRNRETDYKELRKAYDSIIEITSKQSPQKHYLSNIDYLYEYATVKIDPGRQQGKTQYIIDNFCPSKDIIITYSVNAMMDIKARLKEKYHPIDPILYSMFEVYSANCFFTEYGRGLNKSIKRVWIDESKSIDEKYIESIYLILSVMRNPINQIICMG